LISLLLLPYDAQAAQCHALERARLMSLGKTPPFIDGQIASIARTQNLTLVTFNIADFAGFEGLTVTDWQTF
jgi:tRNA(fMet)-specific endonuclease VapC